MTRSVPEINDTLHNPELVKDTAEVLLQMMDNTGWRTKTDTTTIQKLVEEK